MEAFFEAELHRQIYDEMLQGHVRVRVVMCSCDCCYLLIYFTLNCRWKGWSLRWTKHRAMIW